MISIKNIITLGVLLLAAVLYGCGGDNLVDDHPVFKPVTISIEQEKNIQGLFNYIPHDTPYLIANLLPLPEDALRFHLDNSRKMAKVIAQFYGEPSSTSFTLAEEDQRSSTQEPAVNSTSQKYNLFFSHLIEKIANNLTVDKITNLGFTKGSVGVFYEYNNNPVLRQQIDNKKALFNLIKQSEQVSNYSIQWKKCDIYDCLVSKPTSKFDKQFAAVVLDDHIAISSFYSEHYQTAIAHLTKQLLPKQSYKVNTWLDFLGKNQYEGFGDGFINTQYILKTLEDKQGTNAKSCHDVLSDHVVAVPRILFGIKHIEKKKIHTEIVFETQSIITRAIKELARENTRFQQTRNGILEVGVNANISNLKSALNRYANYLRNNLADKNCKLLPNNAINEVQNYLLILHVILGDNQLKNLYLVANHLEFFPDSRLSKNLEGYISIDSNKPIELYQTLMRNQKSSLSDLTTDGKILNVPSDELSDLPIDQLSVAAHKDNIELFLGNYEPDLIPFTPERPLIFWMKVDNERYTQHMKKVAHQQASNTTDDAMLKQAIETNMNNKNTTLQSLSADGRGLIINYNIRYH